MHTRTASILSCLAIAAITCQCGSSSTREDGDADGDADDPGETDTGGEEAVPDGPDAEPDAGCTVDADCDDSDPCTQGVCDTDLGLCSHEPLDEDEDGYPAAAVGTTTCDGTDCDDSDPGIHPDAATGCEPTDDRNCNGFADPDDDGDGYTNDECSGGDDCDDANPDVNPGVLDVGCSTGDDDCNGNADEDNDGDGYTNDECSGGNDCDDANPDVHPDADEAPCDGVDTNCDGGMFPSEDGDMDGWPNETCAPAGAEFDCDDGAADVYPGAFEICDMVDNDCDGSWADGGADDDGDGVLEDSCGGRDCDDTDPGRHWGAMEICGDGIDQDCDTMVDDAGPYRDDTLVSEYGVSASEASAAWTGSRYGVAWVDLRDANFEIYFAIADGDGTLVGSDVRVTDASNNSMEPDVEWTGSGFGIAWSDNRHGNDEIYFAFLDADGTETIPDTRVTTATGNSERPSLEWTGSTFALAWMDRRDGNAEIWFALLDADGGFVVPDTALTPDDDEFSDFPALAWTGTGFGVAWEDDRDDTGLGTQEIYVAILGDDGSRIGSDVRVTDDVGESSRPSLVWTGSGFGLAWYDDMPGNDEIYFAALDADGAEIGSHVRITTDGNPSLMPRLAWSGSHVLVTWYDARTGHAEAHFGLLDPSGAVLAGDSVLTPDDGNPTYHPRPVWAGSEFGVVYHDLRTSPTLVWLNHVADCP